MAGRNLRPRDGYQPPQVPEGQNLANDTSDSDSDEGENQQQDRQPGRLLDRQQDRIPDRPQNRQQQGPHIPPPPPLQHHAPNMFARQAAPVQYIKNLATFQNGSDLLIFLHRFNSYCQALRVPRNMMASLLIAHLDDTSLRGISRHLNDDLTYEEVVELIKKSQGYAANNTDKHITDMAARKRLKTEKMMDYFVDLSRISELAYPNPEQRPVREANLRQEFIKNLNHPMIAARLREHPQMPMEDLLDLAVLLENCYEASKVSPNQVNFMEEPKDDQITTKIANLTNMVEKMVINQVEQEQANSGKTDQYKYQGELAPTGLRDECREGPYRNRSPQPFQSNSTPRHISFDSGPPKRFYYPDNRSRSGERFNPRQNQRNFGGYNNRNGRSFSPRERGTFSGGQGTNNWRPRQRENPSNPSYNRPRFQENYNRRNFEDRRVNNNNYGQNRNNNYNNYNNFRRQNINHIQNFRRANQQRRIT